MTTTLKAFTSDRIFTGENWLSHHAVLVENKLIKDIISVQSLTSSMAVIQFDECILAPAFIDLQIYGAYGKLLAVFPEADSLNKLKDYCEKGGAA